MYSVEVYVGNMDGTWFTERVDVPDHGQPEQEAGQQAVREIEERFNRDNFECAFVGVYHIASVGGEDGEPE